MTTPNYAMMFKSLTGFHSEDILKVDSYYFNDALKRCGIVFLPSAKEIAKNVGTDAIQDDKVYDDIRKKILKAGLVNIKQLILVGKKDFAGYVHTLSFLYIAKGYIKDKIKKN